MVTPLSCDHLLIIYWPGIIRWFGSHRYSAVTTVMQGYSHFEMYQLEMFSFVFNFNIGFVMS